MALAFLGATYLGAHVVLVNLGGVIYVLSAFGYSVTASSLVGSAMNLGELGRAKILAAESILYGMVVNVILLVLFYLLSDVILSFFLPDLSLR